MDRNEAMDHMKRWLREERVERDRFTFCFTHRCQQAPSQALFIEVVEALGGWVLQKREFFICPNPRFHPLYRKRVRLTVADIPGAMEAALQAEGLL